jgi:hypothetical protein
MKFIRVRVRVLMFCGFYRVLFLARAVVRFGSRLIGHKEVNGCVGLGNTVWKWRLVLCFARRQEWDRPSKRRTRNRLSVRKFIKASWRSLHVHAFNFTRKCSLQVLDIGVRNRFEASSKTMLAVAETICNILINSSASRPSIMWKTRCVHQNKTIASALVVLRLLRCDLTDPSRALE